MKKFRIEQCNNGFMVVVQEGKDDLLENMCSVILLH